MDGIREAASFAQSILVSEIAMTYFDLVNLDMKHQITTAAIDFIAKSCELTEDLKDAGEMTQLAVDQFKARLLELKGNFWIPKTGFPLWSGPSAC